MTEQIVPIVIENCDKFADTARAAVMCVETTHLPDINIDVTVEPPDFPIVYQGGGGNNSGTIAQNVTV